MTHPIPEVERTVTTQRRIHRSNVAMVAMVGVTCVAILVAALILFTKIDAKVSHVATTMYKVRVTQQANTVRSNCQDKAFNAALKDARLALQGDHNPADYGKAVHC